MSLNLTLYRDLEKLTVRELEKKLNEAKDLMSYMYSIANAYIDSKYSTDDEEGNKLREMAFNCLCTRVNLNDIFELVKHGLEDADGIAERNVNVIRTECEHLDSALRDQAIVLQRSDIPLRVKYEVFDTCRDVNNKTGELKDLWWKVVTNDDLDEAEEGADGCPF